MAGKHVTDAQIIKAVVATKGLIYQAAQKAGCAAKTIYARMKSSPRVAQAVEEQRGLLVDKGEQKLATAVGRGEPWAIQMLLKTLGKDRGYVERKELTGANGKPMEFVTWDGGDDDDGSEEA
jgi:hypothetical protein